NIGDKLQQNKFQALINPFGGLYNPISIAKNLLSSVDRKEVDHENIIQNSGRFFHFDFHSNISGSTKEDCFENANQAIKDCNRQLTDLNYLFISLGTAWVYRWKEN